MKLEREFEQLEQVQKVEAPEHLFSAIESHIKNEEIQNTTSLKVWSLGIAASILIIASISISLNQHSTKEPALNYAQEFNLVPQNQLYR